MACGPPKFNLLTKILFLSISYEGGAGGWKEVIRGMSKKASGDGGPIMNK